jgi:hypothetical protein
MHHRDSSDGVGVANDYRPDFLVRLGVMLPCSEQDVKEAYFAKVKHAHPDAGGNQEDFVALQTDFERALEYSKFHSGRSRWLAESIERYIEQQGVIAQLEERGARVTLEHIEWLKREVGEDFAQVLDTIAGIRLSGPKVTDADIDYLLTLRPMLETLHWLDLSHSKVTDEGLLKVASFANLRKIDLRGTRVGSAVLTLVDSLPKLEWIGLTDSGVGRIGRFRLRHRRPDLQIG